MTHLGLFYLSFVQLYAENLSRNPLETKIHLKTVTQRETLTLPNVIEIMLLLASDAHRVPGLGGHELTDEAVLLAKALMLVGLHRPHVLQVDWGRNTSVTNEQTRVSFRTSGKLSRISQHKQQR